LEIPFRNSLIQRIHVTRLSFSSTDNGVAFTWIPGHIDLSEQDAFDLAAKQSFTLTKITDNLALATDYKNNLSSSHVTYFEKINFE